MPVRGPARCRVSAGDNQGIELLIEQADPLAASFQILPNALLRGDRDEQQGFDFRGYTLRERALLGALLGMASGYRCSRARIDAIAGDDLGTDAVATIIKGLKRRGHLRTTRVNDPDRSGRFVWQWKISLRPMAAAVEETAGQTMGGSAIHGSPTHGDPPPAIPGSPMHGSPIDGQSGSKYLEDQGLRSTKTTTTTKRRARAATEPAKDGGGGSPPAEDTPELVAARRVLAEVQPTTGRHTVTGLPAERLAELIAERLAAGWSEPAVVAALSGSLAGVNHVAGALTYRITEHLAGAPPAPPAPRQRRSRAADCTACDPAGWIVDPDTRDPVRRCTHDRAAAAA
ncbi:MAG: hypothetical protein V4597_19335 [Pseudomonadota bacterium]